MNKFNFQPLDPILFRHKDGSEPWALRIFSHYGESGKRQKRIYTACGWISAASFDIIPFNDETRHLLGTKDTAPKFLIWEPEPGDFVAVRDNEEESWRGRVFIRKDGQFFQCRREKGLETENWIYCAPARSIFKIPEA